MTITKAKLLEKPLLSPVEQGLETPKPASQDLSPQALLDSLRAKSRDFETLKNEGLVNKDKYLAMSEKLKKTIEELEILIPKLEVL